MKSSEKSDDKKNSDDKSSGISLYVVIFFLSAIIFFILSVAVPIEIDVVTKEGKTITQESEILKHLNNLFTLLSGSFLTTAIFSVLIGFSQFTDFATKKLRDVVIEKKYIRNRSRI